MKRRPTKDKHERKHRRTWKHPEAVAFAAGAEFSDWLQAAKETLETQEPQSGPRSGTEPDRQTKPT